MERIVDIAIWLQKLDLERYTSAFQENDIDAEVLMELTAEDLTGADVLAALIGSRVSRVTTFGRLPEIEVSFSNGLHVLSFQTREGNPAWTLFDRRGPQDRWLSVEQG